MLFAPSIMLGFTATQSKFSLASILSGVYVMWRLMFRPLPPLKGICGLGLLLMVYMLVHGIALTLITGKVIILLLEGQWLVYLIAGLLLTRDLIRERSDIDWAGTALVRLGAIAATLGIVSIWTGPFYSYANHFEGRWGLLLNRACGPFESPAMLAGLLMITFVLSFFSAPNGRNTLIRQGGLVLMMIALLLTQAKGGIFACLIAIIIGIPLTAKTAAKRKAAIVKLVYAGLFVGAILYISNAFLIDVRGLIEDDAQSRGARGMSILSDFANDELAPQIFGIGYRQSATIDPETGMWFPAHNSYISFLREIGILGSVLIGGFLIWTCWGLASTGHLSWAFALFALLVVSYTAEYLYGTYSVFFLGCAGALADRVREYANSTARTREAWVESL
jgi:hypothetical protein